MVIYKTYNLLWVLALVICLSLSPLAWADEEVLSDDEAYARAYGACQQKVSPFWMPKEGEKPPPPRTTKQRIRERAAIAKCMVEYNVPVKYDREEGIVRTGSDFGHKVHIKVEDIFPESVLLPETISRVNPASHINLEGVISPAEIKKSQDDFAKKMQKLTGESIPDDDIPDVVEKKPVVSKVPPKTTPSVPASNNAITAVPNPDEKNAPKPIFLGR